MSVAQVPGRCVRVPVSPSLELYPGDKPGTIADGPHGCILTAGTDDQMVQGDTEPVEEEPDQPAIRVTFEEAAPLFQHELHDELVAEGFDVQPGPPPMEQRSVRDVVEVLVVAIYILRTGREVDDSLSWVAKIVRGIDHAVHRRKIMPETVVTIYGPDGETLKEVRIPRKREY